MIGHSSQRLEECSNSALKTLEHGVENYIFYLDSLVGKLDEGSPQFAGGEVESLYSGLTYVNLYLNELILAWRQ